MTVAFDGVLESVRTLYERDQGVALTQRMSADRESFTEALAHAAAALERREDLIEHLVSTLVEVWRETETEASLHDFIGLTWEQYSAYVEQRYDDVDV